ncbi:MAG: bifunctional riboflavin kinase/FAD synthetase [Lachnospiraceae bacterium]|nr:bifunctional riboflavin kinase/FAD synthetase [Lachnospiraceae bacterium]
MQIITDREFHIEEPTAVAIGKFDGIHMGHKKLLEFILSKKEEGLKSAVFTFDMSAASFFQGRDIKDITTIGEKRIIFEELGIDHLIEYPLNDETAHILPEDFIENILVGMLNMKYVAAGDDLSFGYKGLGNSELLSGLAGKYGYEVEIIDKVRLEGRDISSSFVREEIEKGNMEKVSRLLGHPYSFTGSVKPGFKLGRKLGFPTMNLYPDKDKILPPKGVYYSEVSFGGAVYPGITNIGVRPTVSEGDHVSVETYLYDFDRDMYGQNIETGLLAFKRPEMKFETKEELKKMIDADIDQGREFFGI